MSIKVEFGGIYKSRAGQKIGPMVHNKDCYRHTHPYRFGNESYRVDGMTSVADNLFDEDIISEWSEGPVRTVTSREVVEWSDEVLTVVPHEDGHVLIGFKHPHDQHYISLSKKQMLSACMVMSQIAEAMDDGEGK